MNPFLTKSSKSDDQHVQQIRHKHGRRTYLSVGVGGDSQSLLEQEPIRSKDSCLLSYNIEETYTRVLSFVEYYIFNHFLCVKNTTN